MTATTMATIPITNTTLITKTNLNLTTIQNLPSSACSTSRRRRQIAIWMNDGGWLTVTGYLSEYNGNLPFNISDGYVEYT